MTTDQIPSPPDYTGIDFGTLDQQAGFKEDSVREIIIAPLLRSLGYRHDEIKRSHNLVHPFLRAGSKNRRVELVPDYAIFIEDRFPWVLDAKSPSETVTDQNNISQAYSYAAHPEIRAKFFALCNGTSFALFRTDSDNETAFKFEFSELHDRWPEIFNTLNRDRFHSVSIGSLQPRADLTAIAEVFDYSSRPMLKEIPVKKQQAPRHFGVHGYFTKQSWNVVSAYIRNFSQPGDVVLDPFGGSGITAIEAAVAGRRGIHVDINPLANLLADAVLQPTNISALSLAFERTMAAFLKERAQTSADIANAVREANVILDVQLSNDADVGRVADLFSDNQKSDLLALRKIVFREKVPSIRKVLLLLLSSTVTKFNLTYHPSTTRGEGGGDSAAFRYYRYRVAPNPTTLDIVKYLGTRFQRLVAAKRDIGQLVDSDAYSKTSIVKGTATNLDFIGDETVDYIYTDPPYGSKIAYLDLSAMWLAWLNDLPREEDYDLEAIQGGSQEKSKGDYNTLIRMAIYEMYRVLKFDRWMSFVFAHKDPEFWHLIIESAEAAGFEYIGATPQKNGASSFKKRQHPFTVLSGQLIINFRKISNPRAIMRANLGMDFSQLILETIESVIARYDGATIEQINDELIIKGLELGFLDLLKKEYSDLTPILTGNFEYEDSTEKFKIKKNAKFRTHLDVRLRIRYYLLSFMRRMERQNVHLTFDRIVLEIMPLLKNGTTPEKQTILSVLETVAYQARGDHWRLLSGDQQGDLFRG